MLHSCQYFLILHQLRILQYARALSISHALNFLHAQQLQKQLYQVQSLLLYCEMKWVHCRLVVFCE